MEQVWSRVLEQAHRYPSPHNSQPMKVRVDGDALLLFYDKRRGLPAEPYGIPFGSVCVGIFVETVSIAAHGLGFEVVEQLDLAPMDFDAPDPLHPVGQLTLVPAAQPPDDLDPELLLSRRTSRLPYDARTVPPDVLAEAAEEAARRGHALRVTDDPALVAELVAVNQRTLFYDLENPAVRREIQGYLRYSEREAAAKADGLSARCLALPGLVLRLVLGSYWLWRLPLLSTLVRAVYLRSMRGVPQVAWLKGPFADEHDHVEAGRAFLRTWLVLTRHGVSLHPFGSVITNPRSHRELLDLVGESEHGDLVWLLFRIGYSPEPPRSCRLPLAALHVAAPDVAAPGVAAPEVAAPDMAGQERAA